MIQSTYTHEKMVLILLLSSENLTIWAKATWSFSYN